MPMDCSALLLAAASVGDVVDVDTALIHGAFEDTTDALGETALIKAVANGYHHIVERLLEARTDLHVTSDFGRTALGYAVYEGHLAIVRQLLHAGARVDCVGRNGDSALMMAIRYYRTSIFDVLLSMGVPVNVVNCASETPLILACRQGRVRIVKKLLAAGADLDQCDGNGDTVLIIAARAGFDHIVAALLAAGADVNVETENGQHTALKEAVRNGHVALVNVLLNAGAKAHGHGLTPLMYAARDGHVEIIRLLLETNVNVNSSNQLQETALILAVSYGHTTIVSLLLGVKGIDLEVENVFGNTALLRAAADAIDVKLFDMLCSAGANVHHVNHARESALYRAAGSNSIEMVEAVLAHDVSVEVESHQGWTALLNTSRFGNAGIVYLLLDAANANIHHTNREGESALMLASRRDDVEIIKVLLSAGADVNHTALNGTTALMLAARQGHLAVVITLLANGADANWKDRLGNTVLLHAAESGECVIVDLLLAHGVDVNHVDNCGRNALMVAVAGAHGAVVERLVSSGIDLAHVDHCGRNAIDCALPVYRNDITKLLDGVEMKPSVVHNGWRPAIPNELSWTPSGFRF